jgi:hypothetical protein
MKIAHGEKLFEFRSKLDWINRAQRVWKYRIAKGRAAFRASRLSAGLAG